MSKDEICSCLLHRQTDENSVTEVTDYICKIILLFLLFCRTLGLLFLC